MIRYSRSVSQVLKLHIFLCQLHATTASWKFREEKFMSYEYCVIVIANEFEQEDTMIMRDN